MLILLSAQSVDIRSNSIADTALLALIMHVRLCPDDRSRSRGYESYV